MPIIALDLDNSLAQWSREFHNTVSALYPANVADLSVYDQFRANTAPRSLIQEALDTPDFYRWLEPMTGARDAVWEMQEEGHEVFIVSTVTETNPTCASDKYEWVSEIFGAHMAKRLILTHDKTLVHADYLIDDKPEIHGVIAAPYWEHIVWDMPYNRHCPQRRLSEWRRWRDILPREPHYFGSMRERGWIDASLKGDFYELDLAV